MRNTTGHAFPPHVRLKARREFLLVYERGLRVPGQHLVLFVRPGSTGGPRLGLTATKKVGGSVERNRVRRQLRDAFRRNRREFGAWDVVVNVRSTAVGRTTADLEAELLRLVRRVHKLAARGAFDTAT